MTKHDSETVPDDTRQIWISLVALLVVGFYIFKLFGWSIFPSDEIKAYPAGCKTKTTEGLCANLSYTFNISTYKVNSERQEVIEASDYSQDRYTKCAIVDKNNWNCRYDDESGSFGFNKGRAFNSDPIYTFVSRFEYIKNSAEGHNGLGTLAVWLILPFLL